jgi:hypothetical protein
MSRIPVCSSDVDIDAPLTGFSRCHAGMLSRLQFSGELPALLEAAERSRRIATDMLDLFGKAVIEHHAEEEDDLFPAVLRSAHPSAEHDRVAALVEQLTAQHRAVERIWQELEPALRLASRGKPAVLDGQQLQELVQRYQGHARLEEQQFLPLAQEILGRNGAHMAALGLSLHARHMPDIVAYI